MTGSRYVKAPEPSPEVQPLYQAMLQVLSGAMTVTQAAESVGLSRLRFQTLMHRGLSGLLESLGPQTRGRKPTPETEKALREEVAHLRQENQRLTKQVESTMRMMGLASEWMRKGLRATKAQRQSPTKPTAETPASDGEDDGPARRRLEAVGTVTAHGVTMSLAAAAVGVSAPTVRRWRSRHRAGLPLCRKRGPRPTPPTTESRPAIEVLELLRGCIGAPALAKATGLSRRVAAAVKARTLTQWETTRREEAARVWVQPGVMRGFDAVDVNGTPVLISGDAGVPYRTSIIVAQRYDEEAVARAVAADFMAHGAPLVWRVDRWKAHETEAVLAVLRAHGVLLLHGPPHCPRYYGQLERQNREHREWLDAAQVGPGGLEEACEVMRMAFNEKKPRRTLGWRTAGDAWRSRATVLVDRRALAAEVEARRQRLVEEEALRESHPGMAERIAIEATLIKMGLLRLRKGGWC